MRRIRAPQLIRHLAVFASGALLIVACQQAQPVAEPTASPPPLADTRATATLLPTYTQPILGAGVPPSPAPGGGGGGGAVLAPAAGAGAGTGAGGVGAGGAGAGTG